MSIFMYVFFVGFIICAILACMSLYTPRAAFICKKPTKLNGVLAWGALAIFCALSVALTAPKDEWGQVIIPDDPARAGVSQQ